MNLLVLTEYFPASERAEITGGVEARGFGLLAELAKRHNVTVICSYQGKPQRRIDRIKGITVLRVGMTSPYANVGNIIPRLSYAAMALATGLLLPKVDVVDGYSYLNYPLAAVLGALKRKPVVLTYHESWSFREWVKLKGWWTGTLGAIWTWLARKAVAKRYIAVSGVTKQRLVEQGLPSAKIDVVYNGIDIAHVRGIAARQESEPSIVVTARLIKSKRIDLLVNAVAVLRRTFPRIRLTVLGDGPERDRLLRLVAKHRLQKNVSIRNVQRFDDQLRIMKRHRVFCLPSEIEGFGMAVVAGMACGLPVVCSDIPVLREVTKGAALLFRTGEYHDLAKQLELLLADTRLYERIRSTSLERARVFDWAWIAEQAEETYRKALR